MKQPDTPYKESPIMAKAGKMMKDLLDAKNPDPQKMNLVKLALSYELTRKKLTVSGFGAFFEQEDEFSTLIDKDDFTTPEKPEKAPKAQSGRGFPHKRRTIKSESEEEDE